MENKSIPNTLKEIKSLIKEQGWELRSDKEAIEFAKEHKIINLQHPDKKEAKYILSVNKETGNSNLFVIWFENGEVKIYKDETGIEMELKPDRTDYQGAMVRVDVLINGEIVSSPDFYFEEPSGKESFINTIFKSGASLEDIDFF